MMNKRNAFIAVCVSSFISKHDSTGAFTEHTEKQRDPVS